MEIDVAELEEMFEKYLIRKIPDIFHGKINNVRIGRVIRENSETNRVTISLEGSTSMIRDVELPRNIGEVLGGDMVGVISVDPQFRTQNYIIAIYGRSQEKVPTLEDLITGWAIAEETWVYASSDAPTYTLTTSGNKTNKYNVGMRMKLNDDGTQYFIITAIAYSSPNTTITMYGGTDYVLSGGTITNPYYSTTKAPQGFPVNPSQWAESSVDEGVERNNPVTNVFYNVGGSLTIPIGAWDVWYKCSIQSRDSAGNNDYIYNTAALGLATSTYITPWVSNARINMSSTNVLFYFDSPHFVRRPLVLTTKDVYYLNARVTFDTDIDTLSATAEEIWAICAYL